MGRYLHLKNNNNDDKLVHDIPYVSSTYVGILIHGTYYLNDSVYKPVAASICSKCQKLANSAEAPCDPVPRNITNEHVKV